jgi:2-aminoethylphosphonate transport system ATP-binding protein
VTAQVAQPAAGDTFGSPAAGPAIRFDRVTVHYGRTAALVDFCLDVAAGETVALLGPSGSGKSTALKAIAGFVRPTSGRLFLGAREVTGEPPHRRGLGVVVQQYALFPHLRVADNVAFGLRARHLPRAQVRARVAEMLDLVGMTAYARRLPRELSGGQQQRVAVARALAVRPPVLLLDEPLSALDAALRAELLGELQRLREELPDVAILYVTHDQTEALALAGRVALMREARLVDVGDTQALYRRPPSRFTATFLGGAALLPVDVLTGERDGRLRVRAGELILTVPAAISLPPGAPALLAARPHGVRVSAAVPHALPATLVGVQWRGVSHRLTCRLDTPAGVVVDADAAQIEGLPAVGAQVGVSFVAEQCAVVPA